MESKEKKIERKQQALHAACEVFARYGYQKASMQDIAITANMSKAVLFKYFQSKENLYQAVFRFASDSILKADLEARSEFEAETDLFTRLRKTVDARLELFTLSPYIYQFSYTAAFDPNPFVQKLVREELLRNGVQAGKETLYPGIRQDVSPQKARQLIFWASKAFLEEKLASGITELETLKREYLEWIDLFEKLLGEKEEGTHEY